MFVGEEEDFAGDAEFHGELVKVDEGWDDVLPGLGVDENWQLSSGTYWSLSRALLGTWNRTPFHIDESNNLLQIKLLEHTRTV